MIVISDKSMCCGCTACVTACPAQCLVMRRDKEGFDYPVANPDLCLQCGKCEMVCPVLNPSEKSESLGSYACRSEEMMQGSSSGGVFPVIARMIADQGGVVFGAVLNKDMTVGHAEAESFEEICRMRGSKYVQSDLYSTYEDVRNYLAEGRKVMFTGTPCQIAGLNGYLGKGYDGLLTVESACHGVPSPGLWARYLSALGGLYGRPVADVDFRDKSTGWRKYSFTCRLSDGSMVSVPHLKDPYMALFLQDVNMRPSCYRCPARSGRSGSDIVLADLWNVPQTAPEMNDDRGASLVIVNTEKGYSTLKASGLELKEVDGAAARMRNAGFASEVARPERRDAFFAGLDSIADKDLVRYMGGFVETRSVFRQIYESVHTFMSRIKRRIIG